MSIKEYKEQIVQILKSQYRLTDKDIKEMFSLDNIREELYTSYELYGNTETKIKGLPQTVAKQLYKMR